MDFWHSVLLGAVQGVAEYLPISSSGHLTLLNAWMGGSGEGNLFYILLLHLATVGSTMVVFRREIGEMICSLFRWEWNEHTHYIAKIVLSMLPVGICGVLFKDYIEELFGGGIKGIGIGLVLTSLFLSIAYFVRERRKMVTHPLSLKDALVVGLAQAVAILPGVSRSGATISAGLLLGSEKKEAVRFSFLMVILPVLGEAFLDIIKGDFTSCISEVSTGNVVGGMLVAFVVGVLSCKAMITLIERGKLIYFAMYCLTVGVITLWVA